MRPAIFYGVDRSSRPGYGGQHRQEFCLPIMAGSGRTPCVGWAWAVVLVLAVGVPAAVWLRSQTMKPPHEPYGSPIPRLNRVDRWLYEHYQLGMMDRSRVSQAVAEGRELTEPRLREAARGLADARLIGQVGSVTRKTTWIMVGADGCLLVAGLAVALGTGRYGMLEPVIFGVPLMALAVRQSKRDRERAERARQLNAGPDRAASVPEQPENEGR